MAILLALLSALAYGISDFGAGVASRRSEAGVVSTIVLAIGLVCAAIATAIDPGVGARAGALLWGAASGLGGGAGTLALYQGLAVGRMTIVATLSAVLAAVVPAIVGLATGDSLHGATLVGDRDRDPGDRARLLALGPDRARRGSPQHRVRAAGGSRVRAAVHRARPRRHPLGGVAAGLQRARRARACWSRSASGRTHGSGGRRAGTSALIVAVGVIGGIAGLLFLAATGHGQLAIVAVVTSLYPAFTVLLARVLLAERWSRTQAIGLAVAAAAIVLVSLG